MMNIKQSESQVLVVDIQEKFRPHIAAFHDVEERVKILLQAATTLAIPAVIFEQYPQGLGHTATSLLSFDLPVVEKTVFSAYESSECREAVQRSERDTVIVVGLESHICVQQTVNDLLADNFNVVLVADGICARNSKHSDWALSQMQADGARVLSVESILFQWLKSAKHEDFKAISALIK
ncbi:isochorismatase family protein [Pseudoalteromonas 'SMAR']|uniref:isochorismatase family protein n=1 Tax=Pseudoalteromonas 'SMAR' TaxID=3416908 RepID=UPI003AF2788C